MSDRNLFGESRFWSPSSQPKRESKDDDVVTKHSCPVCETKLRLSKNRTLLLCDGCGYFGILNKGALSSVRI